MSVFHCEPLTAISEYWTLRKVMCVHAWSAVKIVEVCIESHSKLFIFLLTYLYVCFLFAWEFPHIPISSACYAHSTWGVFPVHCFPSVMAVIRYPLEQCNNEIFSVFKSFSIWPRHWCVQFNLKTSAIEWQLNCLFRGQCQFLGWVLLRGEKNIWILNQWRHGGAVGSPVTARRSWVRIQFPPIVQWLGDQGVFLSLAQCMLG